MHLKSKRSQIFRLVFASILLTYHVYASFSFCNPDNYEGCGEAVRSFCYGLDKFCCERSRWCLNPCFPVWCPKEEDNNKAINADANSLISEVIERNEHLTKNLEDIRLASEAEKNELIRTTKGPQIETESVEIKTADEGSKGIGVLVKTGHETPHVKAKDIKIEASKGGKAGGIIIGDVDF
jgi:hypothetical protein